MTDLHYLVMSAVLTWSMLLIASLLRSRGLTPAGLRVAFGNRDDMPEPTPLAARADRAARNMLENLVLFVVLLAAAHFRAASPAELGTGAAIFFWARVVYFFVYLAGVKVVRTLVWTVSLVGLAQIALAAW